MGTQRGEWLLDPCNHLFGLARSGRRLTHVALALAVLPALVVLGEVPLGLVVIAARANGWRLPQGPWGAALAMTGELALGFGPVFLLVWAWVAAWERRPLWTIGLERRGAAPHYAAGVAVGVGMMLSTVGFIGLLGGIAWSLTQVRLAALGPALLMYLGWTVQGPTEEALCRGWLLPTVGARHAPWLGVAVSAAVFASLHGLNTGFGLLPLANLVLDGVFTALWVLREGGLWGVMGYHAAWNWSQGNLLGLRVSGMPEELSVIGLQPGGPAWLTGGAFGPEGGLGVTIVEVLAIIAVVWAPRRRQESVSRGW